MRRWPTGVLRLRGEQPIEGIAVVEWQVRQDSERFEREGQEREPVDFDLRLKESIQRAGNRELPERSLDRDLPAARHAEERRLGRNRRPRAFREPLVVGDPPQEHLCVDEDGHFR